MLRVRAVSITANQPLGVLRARGIRMTMKVRPRAERLCTEEEQRFLAAVTEATEPRNYAVSGI